MNLEVRIKKRLSEDFTLDVSFETERETLGVLGASGSGKSMTLKCIAGIEVPDEGRIVLRGRVLYDSEQRINLSPQARRVGYLFQNCALFPKMTVLQNIACVMGRGADHIMIDELIRRFRLEGLENRRPVELSGGEQQRVALARILASRPEAILLDEPFSALDTHLREQLQLELPALLEGIGNVIFVTHSRDEVYRLCPQLLVLDQGQVMAAGATQRVFENPETVSGARLCGCKNISPIRKLSATRVLALGWGLELETGSPVLDEHTHIGIRAHDLKPASDSTAPNSFAVTLLDQTQDVFLWNLRFHPIGMADTLPLWWKVSKEAYTALPTRLYAPTEALMLLREKRLER